MNEQEMIATIKLNQKKALKILGNEKAAHAIEFTGKEQVDALIFLGSELLENALNFDTKQKLSILKIVGASKQEIALELSQMLDKINPGHHYENKKYYALKAIEHLGHESNELLLNAPLYHSLDQINALTILGVSNAGVGHKVNSEEKLEIMRFAKNIGKTSFQHQENMKDRLYRMVAFLKHTNCNIKNEEEIIKNLMNCDNIQNVKDWEWISLNKEDTCIATLQSLQEFYNEINLEECLTTTLDNENSHICKLKTFYDHMIEYEQT